MQSELFLLFMAAGTGAVLLLFYRVLEFFRRLLPGKMAGTVLDFLYWPFAGAVVFVEIYRYNEGILRFFLLQAVFLGAFLMNYLLKRLLFPVKRCKLLIIMEKRFCNLKRGKQIEKVQKKEKKCKDIK